MSTQTDDVRALMEAFVAEQEGVQASLKRHLWSGNGRRRLFERAVWAHYELLQVWDLLSLFVCLDRHGPSGMQDIGPAPTAPDGEDVMLRVEAAGEGTIRIAPWPFDRPVIDAAVPARAIPARPYMSQRALRDALEVSADATVRCRIVPG